MTDPTPETPQPVVTETPAPDTSGPKVFDAPTTEPKRQRFRKWVLWVTLALAILAPFVLMMAGLGSRMGLWSWQFGLGTLTRQVSPILLGAAGLAGLISLLLWFLIKPRKGIVIAVAAILVAVVGLANLRAVPAKVAELPFIHDISTDTQDPPTFGSTIMAEREATDGVNSVEYAGKRDTRDDRLVSALQTQAYPEIRTLVLSEEPGVVFGRAEQVARDLGWAIKETDAASGRIDATDTTFWYGFKDDVAIRLRPAQGGGTRLDVRSVSRVGGSDLGANAERIGDFLEAMRE